MPQFPFIHQNTFRANDWWRSKAVLMMGMVYLFSAWFHLHFNNFVWLALLSLTTIVGFASFGYLTNDLFDIASDIKAGKKNSLAGKPIAFVMILFGIALALIFTPWLFLPSTNFSFFFIAFQLLLFLAYSIPPLRLKERGLAGLITDALYAHAIPPILAAYTYSLATHSALDGIALLLLFSWQFTSGIRNIAMHQKEDAVADKKSGSKNYIASMSTSGFFFTIRHLIALELLLSIVFFAHLSFSNPLFVNCIATIVILSVWAFMLFRQTGITALYESDWKYFPNNLSEKWLPPMYLILLSATDNLFLLVLLVHLLLFNFDLYAQIAQTIMEGWKAIPFKRIFYAPLKQVLSWIVNYSIFFAFLLVGVNLKKEKLSAAEYLQKRKNKV